MFAEEVSRALEAEVIAKLKFIAAELQKAQRLETKRQREQAPPVNARVISGHRGGEISGHCCRR
jgi:hypothetical protein